VPGGSVGSHAASSAGAPGEGPLALGSLAQSLPSSIPTVDGGEGSICTAVFGSASAVSRMFPQLNLGTPSIDGGVQDPQGPYPILDCGYESSDFKHGLRLTAAVNSALGSDSTGDVHYGVAVGNNTVTLSTAAGSPPFTSANKAWATAIASRLTR
jgi:hypothetical protein